MPEIQSKLVAGPLLARNIVWNVLGAGLPLLVAIVAIPLLIKSMGTARFGVLTLAWMVVGYFSLFDAGLGRALTKLVADKLGQSKLEGIPELVWTAMTLMVGVGVIGAMLLAALSAWLVGDVLEVPLDLKSESLTSFYLLSASVPVVICTTGLRGVLEAHQRFGLVNSVRVPLGLLNYLGPLAVMSFSDSLVPVVTVLVLARAIACITYVALCLHVEPVLRKGVCLNWALVRPLVSFGGWMTVSNIIGPLMVYMDRFIIGAAVSMTAVAYYVTPYEIVTKLWIIPGALMGVLFPAFATSFVTDPLAAARLFGRAVAYTFLALFPVVLVIATLAPEILSLWLGTEFSLNSSVILQLLAVGVFINSISQVPFGLVQGLGHPDWTAKLHLIELPLYLLMLWEFVNAYGSIGAAIAWVMRVVIDTLLLFILAHKILPTTSTLKFRELGIFVLPVALFSAGALITGLVAKILFLVITLLAFVFVAWTVILPIGDRIAIGRLLGK